MRWQDNPAASLADDLRVRLALTAQAGAAAGEEEELGSAGGGTGDEEISQDELTEIEKAAAEGAGEGEGEDYEKRYKDTRSALETANLEKKQMQERMAAIEEQNRQLAQRLPKEEPVKQAEQPDAFAFDEVALAAELGDFVDKQARKLDWKTDPDAYKKTFTAFSEQLLKTVRNVMKPAVEKTASQTASQYTDRQRLQQGAYDAARKALTDEGLDPDQTYDYMVVERNRVMTSDPTWATRTPAAEQFKDLAKRTKDSLSKVMTKEEQKEIEEENAEQRRTAAGIMGRGGTPKTAARTRAAERGEEEEEGGSMTEAINANKKAAMVRGNRAAKMVRGF